MKILNLNLEGKSFQGRATDMDALYIAGLLLPDYFAIRNHEQGLRASFEKFSTENAEALKAGSDNADNMYTTWGERLLIRLTGNLDIRSGFAQRIVEIFPTIDRQLINYKRWSDADGNIFDESSIRLDIDQMMLLVTEIAQAMESPSPSPLAQRPIPKGFKDKSAPQEADPQEISELESLKQRLAELEAQSVPT